MFNQKSLDEIWDKSMAPERVILNWRDRSRHSEEW